MATEKDPPLAAVPDEPKTIEERAEAGEGEEQEALFALDGDRALTLPAGFGPRNQKIESEVSIMSASVPIRGLLDPTTQGQLMVSYVPAGYRFVPVRDGQRITKWKLRQYLRIMYVEAVIEGEESPTDPSNNGTTE